MPVTRDQAQMLATLAVDARPFGAPKWDAPGVFTAIGKVHHLALDDVALAVFRAAGDKTMRTPAPIADTRSSCWRERATDRPAPSVRSTGPWCGICGVKADEHPTTDHRFEPPADRKRDGSQIRQIIEALKGELQPTAIAPPAEPEREPDPRAAAARAALTSSEGVGTGAGEGAPRQDTGSAWVTRSQDCPEAPAQAHPLAQETAQPKESA